MFVLGDGDKKEKNDKDLIIVMNQAKQTFYVLGQTWTQSVHVL